MKRHLLVAGTAYALAVGTAAIANAADLKYAYTGNAFDTVPAGFTLPCDPNVPGCIDSLTIEIIMPDIGANSSNPASLASATSWSISDGVTTITDASGWSIFSQLVETDGSGVPDNWNIEVFAGGFAGQPTGFRTRSSGSAVQIVDFAQYCQTDNGSGCTNNLQVSVTGNPGSWTVGPVGPGAATLACTGFDAPMNKGAVKVKKNRALPLKATLTDDQGQLVDDSGVAAAPILLVEYDSGGGGAVDVTGDALPAGHGTDGNQFEFANGRWRFNLKTKNYSASGTYTISMVSGDTGEYEIDPACTAQFVIN